jgi:hypothetical protein
MFYYGDDRSDSDSDDDSDRDDDLDEWRTTTTSTRSVWWDQPHRFLYPIDDDSGFDLDPMFIDDYRVNTDRDGDEDEDEDGSELPDVMMPADWLSVDLDIDSVEYSFDTDKSGDRESMSVTINVTETQ